MSLKILAIITFLIGPCIGRPDSRIYGGFFAKENQFPYQVAIIENNIFGCGGSIYSKKFILTAAHCVINTYTEELYKPENLKILVGTTNYNENGTYYEVKTVISHKEYNDDRNDIAVIEVIKPIEFNEAVQPIELYTKEFPSGKEVTISGWGQTEDNYMIPYLKYHKLKAQPQPQCGKEVGDDYGGFICIEHTKGNGMCFGDSGGPAMADGKLVGIASLVILDCGTVKPDVYTYVPFYIDWIKQHTTL